MLWVRQGARVHATQKKLCHDRPAAEQTMVSLRAVVAFLKRNATTVAISSLAVVWFGYQQVPLYFAAQQLRDQKIPASNLRMADDGRMVALSEFAGRPILLNFWATWCAPCIAEIPLLNQAHNEFEKQGLALLAVTNEDPSTVAKFRKNHEMRYPVLIDPAGRLGERLRVSVFPTLMFVDRTGRITEVSHGFSPLLRWKVKRLVTGSWF